MAASAYGITYRYFRAPWDIGPREDLVALVESGRLRPCTVIDLGSLNKVKVNGHLYVQRNLRNGDIIQVGQTEFKFVWPKADYEEYRASVPEDFKEALEHLQEEDILLPETDGAVKANE